MASNRLDGLAETYSLLGAIPQAAREQVGVEMALIGREVLTAQRRDVAKRSGALEGGLRIEGRLEELRLRIGLIGIKSRARFNPLLARQPGVNFGSLYYGRFVEFGRRGQTVLVTRRIKDRKITGNGRTSARQVAYGGKAYSMKVKAMAARPFVHKDRPEIRAEQRLANFWSQTLGKAEAAA